MPPKSNFDKFKTTMKRETTRNINTALKNKKIFSSQAEKFINESKKIIDEGKDEETIINDLAIHAYNSQYTPYKTVEDLLKEVELERKKKQDILHTPLKDTYEKKQDILHPPLEDTSTYKDVKKYTKEMVIVRAKNAANIEGTPMNNRRKVRRQNMIEKSRELLPKNLTKEGELLIDYVTKRQFIIDEENEVLKELKEYNEITPIEEFGILEEKDFLDKEYYETLHQYRELKKYLKDQKNEFVDQFLSYVDYQSYAVQMHKQEIDHMFVEFLLDKEEIRKKDLSREREENENNFKKRITITEKEEKKRKNILDEYIRLQDTLMSKEDEFKRLRNPYEQHDKKKKLKQ